MSIRRQCALLGISRSSVYYAPRGESAENLALMRRMDALSLQCPFYGSRQMARHLRREGVAAGRRRVRRLLRLMGLEAIYRKPRTSDAQPDHHVYPYLLRELKIDRPDQVWCADITYIPVTTGFLYLVAIMDWASRHVLSWRLSNTMDSSFCVEALEAALQTGTPGIFNTDQGSQFTSAAFTDRVQAAGARCSMDGRGRCLDNVFIERLWRSLKYEAVYLHELADGFAAEQVISEWMTFYSDVRPHSGAWRMHAGRSLPRGAGGVNTRAAGRGTTTAGIAATTDALTTVAAAGERGRQGTTRGVIYQPGYTLTKSATFPENRTTSASRSLTGSSTVPFHRGGRCFVRLLEPVVDRLQHRSSSSRRRKPSAHERTEHHVPPGTVDLPGLWTPAHRRAESGGRRGGRPQAVGNLAGERRRRPCLRTGREIPTVPQCIIIIIDNRVRTGLVPTVAAAGQCRSRGRRGRDFAIGIHLNQALELSKPPGPRQQSAAARADRGHPTRRVRSAVLCSDQGGLIQRIRSPTFPARFK